MQRKPGLFLIMIVTFFLTIGFQCNNGGYIAIRGISQIEILDLVTNVNLTPPVTTSTDSLALLISFELDHFASSEFAFDLMNEAWADCYDGVCMANEITDIRVFCDKAIYNQSANTDLSELLTYSAKELFEPMSLDVFLEMFPGLNENYYHDLFEDFTLNFTSKPAPGVYTFSVEIEDNNGHVFTATAPSVDWQ